MPIFISAGDQALKRLRDPITATSGSITQSAAVGLMVQ
jgi:hypothetical protein